MKPEELEELERCSNRIDEIFGIEVTGSDAKVSHGCRVVWNTGCAWVQVEVNGFGSAEEALIEGIRSAKLAGWTEPKWWQFWRWGEPLRRDPTPKR